MEDRPMRRSTDKARQGIFMLFVALAFAGLSSAYLVVRSFSQHIGYRPLISLWIALPVLGFAAYGIVAALQNLYRYFDDGREAEE